LLFNQTRVGRHGEEFTLLKFRSMRRGAHTEHATLATSYDRDGHVLFKMKHDPRVTMVGRWLRRYSLDELPQLFNVLRGEMAIVGPRPEDPAIVQQHYSSRDLETLGVRPGLASPGSIYQYQSGDKLLTGDDPETRYVDKLLKTKLALDRVYLRHASMRRDLAIIGRTLWAIGAVAVGRRKFNPPPEMAAARRLLSEDRT
jgi:lipopolysaccharide/colanic/teichoic acid biosynthesis glycosyltransferase